MGHGFWVMSFKEGRFITMQFGGWQRLHGEYAKQFGPGDSRVARDSDVN